MGSLIATRSAWVELLLGHAPATADDVTSTLPALTGVHIYAHGGSFDLRELRRFARQCPALIISLLRFDPIIQAGIVTTVAHWGVIVMTKDASTADRDRTVVELAEAAVKVVLSSFAGQNPSGAVSRPGDLVARNLFSTELDKETNLAMWGFEFTQVLDLVQVIETSDYLTMHLEYDLYPRDPAPVEPAEIGEIIEAEDDIDTR